MKKDGDRVGRAHHREAGRCASFLESSRIWSLSHPKMGFLVNETAARAAEILQSKQ